MGRVRLNPVDDITALFDDTLRASGAPGFHCVQAVELAGSLDRDRLRGALALLSQRHPLTSARLGIRFQGWRPSWRLPENGAVPLLESTAGGPARLDEAAAETLNLPMNPWNGPPVEVHIRRGGAGDFLLLKWSHVLTDGRGGDYLMRELSRAYGDPAAFPADRALFRPQERLPAVATRLQNPLQGVKLLAPWRGSGYHMRLRLLTLDDDESRQLRQAASRVAGFGRQGLYMLAAYLRAMSREAIRRGEPGALVGTHWPVGLREGVAPDALPANEYGFLDIACRVDEAADRTALIERLTRETLDQLARGAHRRLWRTGEWLRLLAFWTLRLLNRRTRFLMRGHRSTTHFRYGGGLLGGQRCWGGIEVVSGFSATVCWPEEPVALGVSQTAGRFHLLAGWADGAVSEPDAEVLLSDLKAELLMTDTE